MRVRPSLLVAFSGLDGAGKSTQIEFLMDFLRRDGRRPICIWTRGGYTPHFQGIKTLLRRASGRIVPPSGNNTERTEAFSKGYVRRLWLILALLDLLWIFGLKVRWWRWRGRVVVCDRSCCICGCNGNRFCAWHIPTEEHCVNQTTTGMRHGIVSRSLPDIIYRC